MRILHVLDHSLPVQSGYAFRSAAILREQRRLGWSTAQVTGVKHGAARQAVETVGDLEYYRTTDTDSILGRLPAIGQLAGVHALRRRLREILAHEKFDIIQAHSPCLNGLAALGLGLPLVYEMRSSWEDAAVSNGTTTEGSLRYHASKWLETCVLRRADAVTTICEGLRQEVIARGVPPERVTVIPNAVDAEEHTLQGASGEALRGQLGLRDRYVLGFIGSFFAWEGLTLLIEALPAVLRERPDAVVLLVGGGVDEPALRAATQRLDLGKHVIFAGTVPHSQVNDYYDLIDLLVYPRVPTRLTEMVTPLKPLEAMSFGKPQVLSDVGGHRELVEDGRTGVLFRAGDPAALAAAILRVMQDPALARQLRENGPPHVREHRTWAKSVGRYAPAYERLLRAGRT